MPLNLGNVIFIKKNLSWKYFALILRIYRSKIWRLIDSLSGSYKFKIKIYSIHLYVHRRVLVNHEKR